MVLMDVCARDSVTMMQSAIESRSRRVALDGLQVPAEKLLRPELALADALARDAPAVPDHLQRARRVPLEPVQDDVPAQLADPLADLGERVADPAVPLGEEVQVLRTGPVVLDAVEVRGFVLLVDRAVEG
jgi:hypothetical protein